MSVEKETRLWFMTKSLDQLNFQFVLVMKLSVKHMVFSDKNSKNLPLKHAKNSRKAPFSNA